MIKNLRKNINTEIGMARELAIYINKYHFSKGVERRLLASAINSLIESMRILNNSVPELLKNISVTRKLSAEKEEASFLENVEFEREQSKIEVTIPKIDREKFLNELSISEASIRKLKKRKKEPGEEIQEFRSARGYLKLSNKFFLNAAVNQINKGRFTSLSVEIKKANIDVLFETYVAMILFTTLISFFVSVLFMIFLMFFSIGFLWPFVSVYEGGYLIRFAKVFWVVLAVPIATFSSLYFYPLIEKKSLEGKIDQELAFAVIHMGAISGSGIAPNEIFRIIGMSKEYPALRKEIRKVLNQINLYGYDLVAALNNTSKNVPSEKLAELFTGLATTIQSGGGLKDFFEKRGDSLLIEYRIEREKYTRAAETFMDLYIGIVIAAPMILMLLLIIISVSGVGFAFTQTQLSFLVIVIISLINIIFLGFLHLKQPRY